MTGGKTLGNGEEMGTGAGALMIRGTELGFLRLAACSFKSAMVWIDSSALLDRLSFAVERLEALD